MLSKFFRHLAKRLTNENDLSDLTWAIAETNSMFLETFMESVGFKEFKTGEPAEIMREVQVGDSRPDFVVTQGEKRYVIENKIWDRQHHFEQYNTTFPDAAKALISAYKLNAEEEEYASKNGFRYSTWGSMVDLLKAKLSSGIFAADGGIVEAYTNFIEEVCGIMELKQVRDQDGVRSLHAFTRLAAWVLEGFAKKGFKCTKYKAGRAFGECWAGQYGELTYSQNAPAFYPLLGMEFDIDNDQPAIMVWVEEDWNKCVYGKFTKDRYSKNSFDYRKDKDDGFLEFRLKDDAFDAFLQGSLERQKELLLNFFSEVIEEIAPHL